jgi:hypothetical protein
MAQTNKEHYGKANGDQKTSFFHGFPLSPDSVFGEYPSEPITLADGRTDQTGFQPVSSLRKLASMILISLSPYFMKKSLKPRGHQPSQNAYIQ